MKKKGKKTVPYKPPKHPRATKNLSPRDPSTERDLKFCERWLVHRDHAKAYLEAGFAPGANGGKRPLAKLAQFRKYLERRIPKIEAIVSKDIALERKDILAGIARIAYANVLDYVVPFDSIDDKTGAVVQLRRLKRVEELTRDQAAALDKISYNPVTGEITYSLPQAKTRLSALTTLGEQAAGFSKKDVTHNHLHIGKVAPEQLQQLKAMLFNAVGAEAMRRIYGLHEDDDTSVIDQQS